MKNKPRKELDDEISSIFNKFAGQIVNPADPNDPVLEEMRQEAARLYGFLRFVPAGAPRIYEFYEITRINAELDYEAGSGMWRIGNNFFRH